MKDYNYLLSMSLMRLSREEVDKLLNERDAKTAELDKLQNITWQQMWTEDLDVFESAYQVRVVDVDSLKTIQLRCFSWIYKYNFAETIRERDKGCARYATENEEVYTCCEKWEDRVGISPTQNRND
jgi:hypothetical protein